jgi:two-component system chemotaxis response regulator CheY
MRALVVDDSRAMRMMLRRTLGGLGFEVLEAEHGAAALAVLDGVGPVDVCLVDWNMPVMDGLEFVKAVRADPEYERMVVVMVTSESDPARILRALMAGADEYATKPLTPEVLAEKLDLARAGDRGAAG